MQFPDANRPRRSAPPPGDPQPGTAAARGLAQAMADEPELIRACLQGIEHEPPDRADAILVAARTACAQRPDYADLAYHVAQAAVAASNYSVAEAAVAHALELNPTYRDALILAARVAFARGRPGPAQQFLEQALAAGADYPDVHLFRGNLWRELGEWQRARAAFTRALELNSELTAAQTALAMLPPAGDGKSNELPA